MFLNILKGIQQKVLNEYYDVVLKKTLELINEAENKYNEGITKKKYVKEQIMEYINNKIELGFIMKVVISQFISALIDYIISVLNDKLGNNWSNKVENLIDFEFDF